jgi:hypothetical protein
MNTNKKTRPMKLVITTEQFQRLVSRVINLMEQDQNNKDLLKIKKNG